MSGLERDSDGRVVPYNDSSISDDDYVLRYVHDSQFSPMEDGRRRLSSGAFSPTKKARDPYQGMSGDLLRHLIEDGRSPDSRMRAEHAGAVKLRVGELRRLGLKVGFDPTHSGDRYHVAVWGLVGTKGKILKKHIRDLAQWEVKPDDVG